VKRSKILHFLSKLINSIVYFKVKDNISLMLQALTDKRKTLWRC